jgi:hypothetical protein
MRKFIVQQWVTVDNIAAEEDGGMSFVAAQPFAVSTDEDFKASAMEFIDTVDTMILGANTYAMSKDYWPTAKDQGAYGEKLNRLTKFVASTKLRDAPWGTFPAATITISENLLHIVLFPFVIWAAQKGPGLPAMESSFDTLTFCRMC